MNVLSIREKINITITATGITAMNLPITPGTNSSGTKATIVVATDATTEGSTSWAPSTAASKRVLPIWRCVKMFSPITMASSTRMPRAIRKANMESMFMV